MAERKKSAVKPIYLLLAVVMLLQAALYIFTFARYKTAYHEDEFFSYALSNSYYKPFIYGSAHQVPDYVNVWTTGEEFHDYITVGKGERFSYGSVWSNQAEDVHPPLYYALLHTISSFFPDSFSWWWGFGINLVCFFLSQLVLFRLVSELCRSERFGLAACTMWGFSIAGQNTQLFIRMYSMLTLFLLLYIYLSHRAAVMEKQDIKRDLLPLGAVTFAGALTQHFFLIYAFFYTLIICAVLLFRKRIKAMLSYGLSVLAGVLLSIAAFPATVPHLFSSSSIEWSHLPDFSETLHQLNRMTLGDLYGIRIGTWQTPILNYVIAVMILLLPLLLGALWLFRKNERLKKNIARMKSGAAEILKTADPTVFAAAAATLVYYFTLSKNISFMDVGATIDRYVFPQLAILSALTVYFAAALFGALKKRVNARLLAGVLSAALCACLAMQNIFGGFYRNYSMSDGNTNGRISSYIEGEDCLMVLSSMMFLPAFSEMVGGADELYLTTKIDCMDIQKAPKDQIIKFTEKDSFYMIYYGLDPWEVLEPIEEITGYSASLCTREKTHFFSAELYIFTKK